LLGCSCGRGCGSGCGSFLFLLLSLGSGSVCLRLYLCLRVRLGRRGALRVLLGLQLRAHRLRTTLLLFPGFARLALFPL